MRLEGTYGAFGYVAAMNIGGYSLVRGLPDVSDVAAVFLAGFVIEDLVLDDVALSLEAGHDAGVSGDAVAIFSCLERFEEDGVCITIIRHH